MPDQQRAAATRGEAGGAPADRRGREVLIVGAGIAGLAAAYELRQYDLGVAIVERRHRAGGLIITERIGDYLVDAGADSFLTSKPGAVQLCRELGLEDHLISMSPPRTAFVLRRGRLVPIPEGAVLGIPRSALAILSSSLFSIPARLRMLLEPLSTSRPLNAGDESIDAFIARRFGREAATVIGGALLAGIHAGDPKRLSVRALFPRLVEAETEHGSILRALRRPQVSDSGGMFRALAGGAGELISRLEDTIAVRPCYGTGVRSIELVGAAATPRYRLVLEDGGTLEAGAVILALPAFEIARLTASFDPSLAQLCGQIPYVSSATIVLAYARQAVRHPLNGSGFVVPRDEPYELLAATWVSSKWARRAPEGHVLLRAFVGGRGHETKLQLDDEALTGLAHRELATILGVEGAPEFARVYRWEQATPQYEIGHLDRVAAIGARTTRWPGLFLTGSGLRGTGIPDAITDARSTASRAARYVMGHDSMSR